ncbi:hypothetical protein JC221_193 [Yersinia phage JC221]|nr:hypothetical protein JC221_193 [Yersinia phage JC221]
MKDWEGTESEHLQEWGDVYEDAEYEEIFFGSKRSSPGKRSYFGSEAPRSTKQDVQYSDGSVRSETVVKEVGGRVITSERIDELKRLYDVAKAAKVGTTIICPVCKTEHIKTTYHKVFCSNGKKGSKDCKSRYWNTIHPERLDRLY